MEACQRTGILDSKSTLYKTLSDLQTVLCGRDVEEQQKHIGILETVTLLPGSCWESIETFRY